MPSATEACFARPKSRTFAWPRLVTKTFAGLMSRWTIPLACAASSRVRNFDAQLQHLLKLDRLATDAVLQRHPVQMLHGDKRLPVLLANLVDSADVRVIQGRSSFGLPLKSN